MARRKRRTKAEIEAEKLAKAAAAAEEEKMVEAGFEKKRARDKEGHFIKDDPSTPENEAWEWVKTEEAIVEIPEESVPEPVVAKEEIVESVKDSPSEKVETPAPAAPTPPAPVAAPNPKPELKTGYDDPMFGLTNIQFGRGRREWRRRTRRGLD